MEQGWVAVLAAILVFGGILFWQLREKPDEKAQRLEGETWNDFICPIRGPEN